MESLLMMDALSNNDRQVTISIINQLGECQTKKELNNIIKTLIVPLMGCSGAFYARFQKNQNIPQLLESFKPALLCDCRWENFSEVATQNHLVINSQVGNQISVLATETFCCIGQACQKCSLIQDNTFRHQDRCCTIAMIFDSPRPVVALYLCRFTQQTEYYSERDLALLQQLRITLLQTIKAIIFQEECFNLQQILNSLPECSEPLALVNDDGKLVYKNRAFEQIIGKYQSIKILAEFEQNNSEAGKNTENNFQLSQLGRRLYEVRLNDVTAELNSKTGLKLCSFTRITNESQKINRMLDTTDLSSREQEITTLIYLGHTTQQISEQLNLSYHTVRNHIKHIYLKIGVSTRSEMLIWIRELVLLADKV